MGLTKTTNYDVSGNFTFDSSLIEFVGGVARLKTINNPGQTFTQAFSADTGFTYDSAKAEFTGGVVRQKDQYPNVTFAANFNSSINGVFGGGSLTGTSIGGGSASGGVLLGNSVNPKGAKWAGASNVTSAQVGTVRFRLIPQFSGAPGGTRVFFVMRQSTSSLVSSMHIYMTAAGNLTVDLYNSAGALAMTITGAASFTAGNTYEIEFNYDITAGASRLFLNGTQVGSTNAATFTRTLSHIVDLVHGSNYSELNNFAGNSNYEDLLIFSTVQHTANYTPGYTVGDTRYVTSKVDLPNFTYSGLGSIQAYTAFSDSETGNASRFIINGKYWDGNSWVVSNNSYSQASPFATINSNIGSLTPASPTTVSAVFDNTNSQSSLDTLTITYTGQTKSTANPTVTINSALILDAIESFSAVITAAGSDAIKFTVLVAGASGGSFTEYYWSGAAWVTANGTYAQSNTAAEINTNGPAFSFLSTGKQIKIKAYLHSDNGTTTPDITSYTIGYSFFAVEVIPGECIVYGWLLRQDGTAISGATVRVRNPSPFMHSGNLIPVLDQTTTTNSAGYWEMSLIETETVAASYNFSFETSEVNERDAKYGGVIVPNDEFALFSDLV